MTDLRLSKKGVNQYWNNTGAYQKEYEELYAKLVPASGEAKTYNGELLRAISRLGYEYNNNGNCNTFDANEIEGDWVECSSCHGSGVYEDEDGEESQCEDCGGEGGYYEESDWEYTPDEMYHSFISLLRENFGECKIISEKINQLEKIVDAAPYDSDAHSYYSEDNENVYDQVTDFTIYYILNHKDENKQLPDWYINKVIR